MRILIATDQFPPMVGGVSTVTRLLAQDLAAAGHHVWVVAPSEGHHDQLLVDGAVRVHRFASLDMPAAHGQRLALLPLTAMHRLLRTIQPDVVHVHSPLVVGGLAQLLALVDEIPVVGTNHFMPLNVAPTLHVDAFLARSLEALTYGYLVGFYNRCDLVTAPTVTAVKLLVRHKLRAPAQAVSNGIDLERYTPGPRDEALRHRWGLPADRPLVLYVGRLSHEKRLPVLLDAVARLSQLQMPAHLVIGGTGPARDALEQQAWLLGITERVTFLGHVAGHELVPLYRLADVFAIPSTAELQSLVTLEAMAIGLPVVAADAGALPELVHDGANGFLFPPDDSAALAERLDRLVGDSALRLAMSEQSRAIAAQHDRQEVVRSWQQLYADVVAARRAPSIPDDQWAKRQRVGSGSA